MYIYRLKYVDYIDWGNNRIIKCDCIYIEDPLALCRFTRVSLRSKWHSGLEREISSIYITGRPDMQNEAKTLEKYHINKELHNLIIESIRNVVSRESWDLTLQIIKANGRSESNDR